MNKLLKIFLILVFASVLFTGCVNPDDPGGGNDTVRINVTYMDMWDWNYNVTIDGVDVSNSTLIQLEPGMYTFWSDYADDGIGAIEENIEITEDHELWNIYFSNAEILFTLLWGKMLAIYSFMADTSTLTLPHGIHVFWCDYGPTFETSLEITESIHSGTVSFAGVGGIYLIPD